MKKHILFGICALSLLFNACNDDFLEYAPITNPTEETAFVSYENFKTYSWGLYDIFSNGLMRQNVSGSTTSLSMATGDILANYLYNASGTNIQNNAWQWNNITSTTNNDSSWDFAYIRRVNIMLRNIDQANMTDQEKAHWRAVGYFFRSYRYYDLLARYGDVPWLENVVSDEDREILFGTQTPRDEVAANILRDLKFAEENIQLKGDGHNTINRDVVLALMSRFCLFEGTWRKYHNLQGAETYLNECKRVSEELINSHPNIATNYVDLWSSGDLSQTPGILDNKVTTKK